MAHVSMALIVTRKTEEQNTTENCSQAARLLIKADDKISSFAVN